MPTNGRIKQCEVCGSTMKAQRSTRRFCDDCRRERHRQYYTRKTKSSSCKECGGKLTHSETGRSKTFCESCATERLRASRQKAHRKWCAANRQHIAEYDRRKYEANRDALLEQTQAWRKANPGAVKADHARAAAAVYGCEGEFSPKEWDALVKAYDGRCAYCNGIADPLETDHMTPLSRGGTNYIANVVPACRSCNRHKSASTAEEFAGPDIARRRAEVGV